VSQDVLLVSSGLLHLESGLASSELLLFVSRVLDLDSLSLILQKLSSLLLSLFLSNNRLSSSSDSVGVELGKSLHVLERVSLVSDRSDLLLSSDSTLDLVRVDDLVEISSGHQSSWKLVVFLDGCSLVCSVDGVELLESVLGPDAESSEVTSRSELQKVQVVD